MKLEEATLLDRVDVASDRYVGGTAARCGPAAGVPEQWREAARELRSFLQ